MAVVDADAAVIPRLQDARAVLAEEWRAYQPVTPDEIDAFYRDAQGIDADLDAWHQLPERQEWTRLIVGTAQAIGARSVLDIGCGAGHDLLALREAGIAILQGVEPNQRIRDEASLQGLNVVPSVYAAKPSEADLITLIDVLEHVPNPDEFVTWIAERARLETILIETTATFDTGTPLHLKENRGWHPGRALERCGWAQIDARGRLRVWKRIGKIPTAQSSLLLVSHRAITAGTMWSILALQGWRLPEPLAGDALVSRARSKAVSTWWRETASDVFLMVDDDIAFSAEAAEHVVALVRSGLPIVAGAYPVHNGAHLALRPLTTANMTFGPTAEPIEVEYAATGFMAVHRRVIDDLVPTLPLCHADQLDSFWPFFMPFTLEKGDVTFYLSEDWAFVERARQVGHKVYLDPSAHLTHTVPVPMDVQSMHQIHAAITRN